MRLSIFSCLMDQFGYPRLQSAYLNLLPIFHCICLSKCLICGCLFLSSRITFWFIFIASSSLPKFYVLFLNFLNILITGTWRSVSEISTSVDRCGFVSIVCFSLGFHLILAFFQAIGLWEPDGFSRTSHDGRVLDFHFISLWIYRDLCLAPQLPSQHILPGFQLQDLC